MYKKETKKQGKASDNNLWTIYGARESASGERMNISLIRGEGENREWGCISIPKDCKDRKIKMKVNDYEVKLEIPRMDIGEEQED